ncbi:MAG: ABC transporter permease [Clostridia bacterium]|nr:ABC transporter permease [Clostridia bacterium]
MAHSTTSKGTGYVDRSVFAQLGDFFSNMIEMRVFNAKGKEVKSVDPVNLWTWWGSGSTSFDGKLKEGYTVRPCFNLGKSIRLEKGQYVTDVISTKMSVSMSIGLVSLAVSLVLGVVFGVLQARFKGGLFDSIGTAYTVLVNAVPHLVIYTIIMIGGAALFGLPMRYDATAAEPWRTMVLPIVCLSIGSIAGYMLWTRRYMVDELNKDYIRLAKLKGLSDRKVMFRHVLKNAFVPLAQYLPYSILLTVGGSLLVERFFAVPGMGPELTNAISRYDLNLVQGIVLLYATMGILGVFLGDLLMTFIDPRIKLTGKGDVR